MRTLLFFIFCTSAGFTFASPSELETEECLPYVICKWPTVELSVPEDACELTVTIDDVVNQYGTSCGFSPSLSITGGSNLELGLHTVRVRVRYGSRSVSCTTRVKVEDNIVPEIYCNHLKITAFNIDIPPTPGILYTASDNCGIVYEISIYQPIGGYGTAIIPAFAIDEAGNASSCSSKFTILDANDPYCSMYGNTFLSHINRVKIGNTSPSINNETGFDFGYGYYVNKKALIRGNEETTIELEPAYNFNSYRMFWRVYIDLNKDDDFSDAGEMIYQWNGIGSHTGSFMAPAYPGLGDYRLRVVMSFGGYVSACPSGTFWGEMEDYNVQFSPFFIPWQGRPATVDRAQIFPNPLSVGQLPQLKLEADHAVRQIKISNSIGQEVAAIPVADDGAQQVDLDRRTMQERGLYLVTAIDENGQPLWTKKWLVQ